LEVRGNKLVRIFGVVFKVSFFPCFSSCARFYS
jgi:hypothetical protein